MTNGMQWHRFTFKLVDFGLQFLETLQQVRVFSVCGRHGEIEELKVWSISADEHGSSSIYMFATLDTAVVACCAVIIPWTSDTAGRCRKTSFGWSFSAHFLRV